MLVRAYNKLKLMTYILRSPFVITTMKEKDNKYVSAMVGTADTIDMIMMSLNMVQTSKRIQDDYMEQMVESGRAKNIPKATTLWDKCLKLAIQHPYADLNEIITQKNIKEVFKK